MLLTYQFENFSVWDHGQDVHAWFLDLYLHLTQGKALQLNWRLPSWFVTLLRYTGSGEGVRGEGSEVRGAAGTGTPSLALLPLETLRTYQLYHDCGKPFCRTVDDEGRQHFPNHAEVSYQTWMRYAETPEDGQVGDLIRMDMIAHTVKGDAINTFIRQPEATSLLLTALAEIHSNVSQLGQLESDTFKIKFKQLEKLGKKLIAHLAPIPVS